VPYNNDEFKGMIDGVDKQFIRVFFDTGCIINICDVKSAVKRLKAHKNDGDYWLLTDAVLDALDDCLLHISWLLFTAVYLIVLQ